MPKLHCVGFVVYGGAGAKVKNKIESTKFAQMKVIEIMKLGHNIAKSLQGMCVSLRDFEHIEMYDEYIMMLESGLKKCYIVAFLSEKYKVSERKVYYVIKKFSEDCKLGAV